MKCTSCGKATLTSSYLEPQLPCFSCSECGGNFLMLTDFLRWKTDNHIDAPASNKDTAIEAQETTNAMICPKTGRLMTKYKLSSDSEHRLDLSPTINAVWMDKGEWELLKANGLANKLNSIFTDHWQEDIREEESTDILSGLYQRRFGDKYEDIKAFRLLLKESEFKSQAIAYLMAEDPYKP